MMATFKPESVSGTGMAESVRHKGPKREKTESRLVDANQSAKKTQLAYGRFM